MFEAVSLSQSIQPLFFPLLPFWLRSSAVYIEHLKKKKKKKKNGDGVGKKKEKKICPAHIREKRVGRKCTLEGPRSRELWRRQSWVGLPLFFARNFLLFGSLSSMRVFHLLLLWWRVLPPWYVRTLWSKSATGEEKKKLLPSRLLVRLEQPRTTSTFHRFTSKQFRDVAV